MLPNLTVKIEPDIFFQIDKLTGILRLFFQMSRIRIESVRQGFTSKVDNRDARINRIMIDDRALVVMRHIRLPNDDRCVARRPMFNALRPTDAGLRDQKGHSGASLSGYSRTRDHFDLACRNHVAGIQIAQPGKISRQAALSVGKRRPQCID